MGVALAAPLCPPVFSAGVAAVVWFVSRLSNDTGGVTCCAGATVTVTGGVGAVAADGDGDGATWFACMAGVRVTLLLLLFKLLLLLLLFCCCCCLAGTKGTALLLGVRISPALGGDSGEGGKKSMEYCKEVERLVDCCCSCLVLFLLVQTSA